MMRLSISGAAENFGHVAHLFEVLVFVNRPRLSFHRHKKIKSVVKVGQQAIKNRAEFGRFRIFVNPLQPTDFLTPSGLTQNCPG
jgi:hypothetical protein